LLPTANGVGANIKVGGEKRLAGVEGLADAPDFAGRDRFGARGNMRHAEINGLAALVGGVVVLERCSQVVEYADFDLFWDIQSPESFLTCATQSRICPRCSSLASKSKLAGFLAGRKAEASFRTPKV
jgi:hypothetical protein